MNLRHHCKKFVYLESKRQEVKAQGSVGKVQGHSYLGKKQGIE